MATAEQITRLVTEIGDLDDSIETILQTADDAWAVELEAVTVEIEFDEARNTIMLQTIVGLPLPVRRAETLSALLAYNFLWKETGGVRLALAGVEGPVVQLVELSAEATAKVLVNVVVNMATNTATLRQLLGSADVEPAPALDPTDSAIMRV